MRVVFSERAWAHYLYWQSQDAEVLREINDLIKECTETPFAGAGKPKPLVRELSGYWSRRITPEHRLVYKVADEGLIVIQCRYHY